MPVNDPHDPYRINSIEQLFALFDGGDFVVRLMDDYRQFRQQLLDYQAEHGAKGCKGSMTITITHDLGKSNDVAMGASAEFKTPKTPPSSAAAFIDDNGQMSLYSPMMRRMHEPPQDVTTNYDPETGEVLDPTSGPSEVRNA